MRAHILEPSKRRTEPPRGAVQETAVTEVGTFATGQSPQGTFHVAADAKVGNFASGLAADDDARTA